MKRTITTTLLAIVLGLTIVFTGCAGFQLTDTQEFAVTKLARIAGITLAFEKPEEIERVLSYIEYIQNLDNGSLRQSAIDIGIKYIYEIYGKTSKTVILVAEVVDLINKVVPPDVNIGTGEPIWDDRMVNMAIDGFKKGVILAR